MDELEEKLISVINESNVPLEAKCYVAQVVSLKLKEAYLSAKLTSLSKQEVKEDGVQ